MNILERILKFLQSEAHSAVSKMEDPVKLIEQGIRDLKKDFDESMQSVAKVKAISIGAKKELETKKQIAKDYEQKALIILQKAQNGELDSSEADRLASAALEKKQHAVEEVNRLTENIKNYDNSLAQMEHKILELKNQIQKSESEYAELKARATVAKTTKKINQQLASTSSDSTMAMLEDMKQRIREEENLAEAYGEVAMVETSVDDEINKAIGTSYNPDVQAALAEMKQKLLANPETTAPADDIESLKKELDS